MMKRLWKRLSTLALGMALFVTTLTVAAGAVEAASVSVEMRPDVEIVVDGTARTFYNVQGQEVHTLYYNGTHYLPVRAIGELMGKNVNWDQSTRTISLAGSRTTGPVQGTPDTSAKTQMITAELHPDFTITVDGVKRTFTDAQGNAVYPMLYQGTNYLPVRAIGELMGKSVSWNGATRTITLSGGSQVTDADSFGPSGIPATTNPTTPNSGLVSEETAKAKALTHAGLTASQVTFLRCKLDWDDCRQVYDVEFYTKDYKEYDYEIDARTGEILSYDYDAEASVPQQNGSSSYIGEAKAKSIALSAAGFSSGQVSNIRCYLERDDGRWEYTVEFWQGTMEYEFEIDAYSGTILSRDVDSIYD